MPSLVSSASRARHHRRHRQRDRGFARDVAGYPRAVEAEAPRDGPVPTLVAAASPEEEARRVHEAVEHACVVGNPAAAGRVAVLLLSSRDDRRDERLRRAARIVDRLRTTRTVTWANDPDDEDARLRMATTDDEVVVASAHLAKGFDFPSVVVAGLGEPQRLHPRQRAALYVACTRAVDELQVVILKR